MAQPAEDILIIATEDLGADGFVSKSAPTGLILTEGFSKQSLSYQKLNYMQHNFGSWLKYINEEQIPDADQVLQDQIDTIVNTTISSVISAALDARDNARYPVGHTLLTMTSTNPSVGGYPGTWSLLYTSDSDIKLGDGSNQNGVASGNNSPAVPLKNHNHTATFSGNALPTHTHGLPSNSNDQTADGYVADSDGGGTPRTANTGATSAGTPSGSVTVNTTGDGATPTLDVRGKGVAINVWQRTA